MCPAIGRSWWTLRTSERSEICLMTRFGQLDGHAVDELQAPAEPAAELLDFLLGVGLLPRLDRRGSPWRCRAAGPSATSFPCRAFRTAVACRSCAGSRSPCSTTASGWSLAWRPREPRTRSGRPARRPRSATNVDALENALGLFLWIPSEHRKWSQSLRYGYPPAAQAVGRWISAINERPHPTRLWPDASLPARSTRATGRDAVRCAGSSGAESLP